MGEAASIMLAPYPTLEEVREGEGGREGLVGFICGFLVSSFGVLYSCVLLCLFC
jgi:hypothetical protein